MVIISFDLTETKGRGIACYIKTSIFFNYHQSLSQNFENVLIDILLPKSKPIILGIIYRPLEQSSSTDDFNIALKELASQRNETYFLGDLNLFFEGQFVEKDHTQNLRRLSQTKDC